MLAFSICDSDFGHVLLSGAEQKRDKAPESKKNNNNNPVSQAVDVLPSLRFGRVNQLFRILGSLASFTCEHICQQ